MKLRAAENLTPLVQPVADGSSIWRGDRTHVKLNGRFSVIQFLKVPGRGFFREASIIQLAFILTVAFSDAVCATSSCTCVFLTALIAPIRSLIIVEARLMCDWWPVLHAIGSHAPGYRVHTFAFVICFPNDGVT